MNYKKSSALITAIVMLILLCGCSDGEGMTMSDICVFHQRSDGVPVKTLPKSGVTSTVCVDPLCTHGEECPLYGCVFPDGSTAITVGNYYCFARESRGETSLLAYDMTSGEVRELTRGEDSLLLMYGYERYLYYSAARRGESGGEVVNSYEIFRADIGSGKIISIQSNGGYSSENRVSTEDFPSIYAIDSGRIFWYTPAERGYIFYTTDLPGKDRRGLDIDNPRIMNGAYHDGWAYYTIFNNTGSFSDCDSDLERLRFMNEKTLRRCNVATGEDELVLDNLAEYIVTDGGVYFTVCESEPREIKLGKDTYYDLFAGKIYRMKTDGSEPELFCSLGQIDLSVHGRLFLGCAGSRLALAFRDEIKNDYYDSGFEYNISPDIIIVDGISGEWELSRTD